MNIWLAQSVKLVLTLHNISSYLPDDSYSTLFFFHLSTCFFSITTLQWQIILVQGKGTPLTQFIRSVGFFYYLYDTKFHVKTGSHTTTKYEANKISCLFKLLWDGKRKEFDLVCHMSMTRLLGKIQNKGFCSPIIITFPDNFRTVRLISGILKIGQCYNLT